MSVSLSLSGFGGTRILENLSESSGGSCGKDTHLAEQVSLTQPATHASPAHFYTFQLEVFSGVELVSRATYVIRKRRNWETRQRKSKAYKRAEGEAKRKLFAQPEISHEAAEQVLRSQDRREFSWNHTCQSPASSPSYMATPMCFSANSVEPSTLVAL